MKRCCLVCYDISNQKRWRKVFKIMHGFGEHWQYSVFFCVLQEVDRVRMEFALMAAINHAEDQAIIIDLGPDESSARESTTVLGTRLPAALSSGMLVL